MTSTFHPPTDRGWKAKSPENCGFRGNFPCLPTKNETRQKTLLGRFSIIFLFMVGKDRKKGATICYQIINRFPCRFRPFQQSGVVR